MQPREGRLDFSEILQIIQGKDSDLKKNIVTYLNSEEVSGAMYYAIHYGVPSILKFIEENSLQTEESRVNCIHRAFIKGNPNIVAYYTRKEYAYLIDTVRENRAKISTETQEYLENVLYSWM